VNRNLLLIAVCGAILGLGQDAVAAPAGGPNGPPPFVGGPPPAALLHTPPGNAFGRVPTNVGAPSLAGGGAQANAAAALGKLNAAHASPTALEHAAPNSAVGAIATYQSQMNSALALTDPMAKDDAITAARQQLALTGNKQLTPSAITQIDGMLGISGADPTLGTTP